MSQICMNSIVWGWGLHVIAWQTAHILIIVQSFYHSNNLKIINASPLSFCLHWGEIENVSLNCFLSSLFRKLWLQRFFCWLFWTLCLSETPQLQWSTTQPRATKKVFSIITYYMCLANQKHLQWILLKQLQNNSKIRPTHAGSVAHTPNATLLHCQCGPICKQFFLAGHSCGNEYQIWFCS